MEDGEMGVENRGESYIRAEDKHEDHYNEQMFYCQEVSTHLAIPVFLLPNAFGESASRSGKRGKSFRLNTFREKTRPYLFFRIFS